MGYTSVRGVSMNKKKVDKMVSQIPPHIRQAIDVISVEENFAVFTAIGQGVDTLDYLTRECGEYPLRQLNELLKAGLIEGGEIRPYVCKVQWTMFGVDLMNRLCSTIIPKVDGNGPQSESTNVPCV